MPQNPLFFSGYEYFAEHNDELYPEPESILSELDGFVNRQGIKFSIEDIKNEISNAENRVQNISLIQTNLIMTKEF